MQMKANRKNNLWNTYSRCLYDIKF